MHPNIFPMATLHDIYSVLAAAGAEVLLAGAARPGGGAGGRHRGRQQSASGGKLSEPSRLTLHCPSADSARLHDRVSQAGGPPAAQHEGPGGHQGGTTHHTLVTSAPPRLATCTPAPWRTSPPPSPRCPTCRPWGCSCDTNRIFHTYFCTLFIYNDVFVYYTLYLVVMRP